MAPVQKKPKKQSVFRHFRDRNSVSVVETEPATSINVTKPRSACKLIPELKKSCVKALAEMALWSFLTTIENYMKNMYYKA